jgi:hypothetical protein
MKRRRKRKWEIQQLLSSSSAWIEKLLQKLIEDRCMFTMKLIIIPYLIVRKGLPMKRDTLKEQKPKMYQKLNSRRGI